MILEKTHLDVLKIFADMRKSVQVGKDKFVGAYRLKDSYILGERWG